MFSGLGFWEWMFLAMSALTTCTISFIAGMITALMSDL